MKHIFKMKNRFKTKIKNKFKARADTGVCPYGWLIFLVVFILFSGCSEDDPDTSARFTLNTPPFPEIQEMRTQLKPTLEIAGKTCLLSIDDDLTLSGQCPGLPIGTHAFVLKYERPDLKVTLASASGNAIIETGNTNNAITLSTLDKTLDDDGDQHTNLSEAMFGSDPLNASDTPPIPPFEAPSYFSTGNAPNALMLGLLDADAIPDLVVSNGNSDTVSVRLGKSDGTLQAAIHYASGPTSGTNLLPTNPVLAQMNAGTSIDIVLINTQADSSNPGSLAVLLGNGDGSFQNAQITPLGNYPSALIVGDLNQDGDQDVIVGHFEDLNISVLLGNGDGTFQAPVSYPTGSLGDVTALALGDFDGDGALDVIASVQSAQNILIFLGNGDGTFQTQNTISVGIIISLGLANLNQDTNLDIVAAIASDIIAILIGNGDGSFQTPTFFKAGKSPGSLLIQDIDGDGKIDLLTENETEALIALLLGKGDGTFKTPVFFEAGTSPSWIAVGDINQDGASDLFFTDRNSDRVGILLSR